MMFVLQSSIIIVTQENEVHITGHAQFCNSQVSYGAVHCGPGFCFRVDKSMSFQHITQRVHT